MKFLRKKDDDCYRIASMQARLFAISADDEIPSYYFIKAFMYSKDAKMLDDLSFLLSGSSEAEIYLNILSCMKKKSGGTIYPKSIMHWIGFFYRYASYLTGIKSKELFEKIPPKYLLKVYPLYHGVDIQKAIQMVFDDLNFRKLTPQEVFMKEYLHRET